jgi:Arc/MetJ-type ribon-helix-helix transcriptional regulator
MKKAPRGRPKKDDAMQAPIPVRLPDDMRREIEEIQASRRDAPGLSQVIRELLAKALEKRK